MALVDLGNGTGKIYQVKPSGAIDTYPNTAITLRNILISATGSRIIYEAQAVDTFDFTDPVYGSTYWFNNSGAAPVGDITGAIEVTDYFIVDTRNDAQQGDIVAGSYTVIRRSRITIIPLVPETGTSDDLIALAGDLLIGDLVILLPKGGGTEYTITIKDKDADGVVGGNFKLHNNQDVVLVGTNDVCLFIKNSDSIKEIARPDSQLLSVANKTLTSPGGTYYVLDPNGGAARVKTNRGLVVLGGGSTLASGWQVWGENGGDTSISQGTTLEIILDSPLVTDIAGGTGLTIFGIDIPDIYCLNYNFIVRAWYNDSDPDPLNWGWEARMYVDQLKEGWTPLVIDGGSGEPTPIFTANSLTIEVDSPAYAIRTISHNENTIANVRFYGQLVSSVMSAGASAGAPIVAASFGTPGWLPTENIGAGEAWFICPFYTPGDINGYTGLVRVTVSSSIRFKVISGFTLNIGDYIDLASISYVAETI